MKIGVNQLTSYCAIRWLSPWNSKVNFSTATLSRDLTTNEICKKVLARTSHSQQEDCYSEWYLVSSQLEIEQGTGLKYVFYKAEQQSSKVLFGVEVTREEMGADKISRRFPKNTILLLLFWRK